jgi:deoxyadenosine kinase
MSEVESYSKVFSNDNLFIGVSGIIGVGKSTVTKLLSEKITNTLNEMKCDAYYEPVKENPILPLFYKDPKRYGFEMQIFLLNKRFRQHQQVVWSDNFSIQDRTIYEDVIFAKMLTDTGFITKQQFNIYNNLFINMTHFLYRPDILVYLKCDPEIAIKRIAKRNRDCEKNISLDYIKSLNVGYEKWVLDIKNKIPIIIIDWNRDWTDNWTKEQSIDYLYNEINKELKKMGKPLLTT